MLIVYLDRDQITFVKDKKIKDEQKRCFHKLFDDKNGESKVESNGSMHG